MCAKVECTKQFLDEEDIPKPLPVFKWLPIHNVTFQDHCRNSQQGSTLIVDELGKKTTCD